MTYWSMHCLAPVDRIARAVLRLSLAKLRSWDSITRRGQIRLFNVLKMCATEVLYCSTNWSINRVRRRPKKVRDSETSNLLCVFYFRT